MSSGDSAQYDDATITLQYAESTILRFLAERDDVVENLDLITIAVRKAELDRRDINVTDLPYGAVHDQVTTVHLPALDNEKLIKYNRVNKTATLAVCPDEIESRM